MAEPQFVILGATGDLTGRFLMPAVAGLHRAGHLPIRPPIVCGGRQSWDTATFRERIAAALGEHAAGVPAASRAAVVAMLEYRHIDAADAGQLATLVNGSSGPVALYLALPPAVAAAAIRALADVRLPAGSRLVAEKPFGTDRASAAELNRLLARSLPEQAVFRIDHFLGKQTVQNVLGLRFANRVFEYLWGRDHIERIEITFDETVALEGRAGYYDRAGALRDMVQNHLLQLMCLIGMEPPTGFDERGFRDRKADLLRAVRTFTPEEAARYTVRARYTAGRVGDRDLPNYVDEPGVDPKRNTETFTAVTLFVDNWRWAGVPFHLRTGKALAARRQEIAVHFRPVPFLPFVCQSPPPNVLRLSLNPDQMALSVNINGPGEPFVLEPAALESTLAPQSLPAYARLLLDLFHGDAVLAIRGDEAEESWRIVAPILAAWGAGRVPLRDYPAGSNGP